VGEKIFFTIFLGVREDSAMMFPANGNNSRTLKIQIENQSNDNHPNEIKIHWRAFPFSRWRNPPAWHRFALL
jgi:hypothetical protein